MGGFSGKVDVDDMPERKTPVAGRRSRKQRTVFLARCNKE
jgi:hypothetical protein